MHEHMSCLISYLSDLRLPACNCLHSYTSWRTLLVKDQYLMSALAVIHSVLDTSSYVDWPDLALHSRR